jgi:hypothetical protein
VIVATLAALLVLPAVVLRGATLLRCYAASVTLALFAWIVWRRVWSFDPERGRVAFIAWAVLELALFALFLARGSNVRWSAGRAAVVAAIVYALTIPAMLHVKIDGDEPFYLLLTESLLHDGDVDLANQYRTLAETASGRTDLGPQGPDDPRGAHGEQYSRLEPFLPLLMTPGYAAAGLRGALAVIALFGVLLVRSTVRWMQDEGIPDDAIRVFFPFFAFAPPLLFYATRIWPEVPAAFFFVEALRGVRAQRRKRWVPALFGLVMLKLRFVLVAAGLIAAGLRTWRSRWIALAIVTVPLVVLWAITSNPANVHSWRELIPVQPMHYVRGILGLLVDGMGGLAFQAPFYLFGVAALLRWRETPPGFRTGILASLLYLFFLVPRQESFSGWAPPLRYLVFLMPVLALGAAAIRDRIPHGALALAAAWTIGLVIHGIAWPWRLFHEANGETAAGEWLSVLYRSDFSRLVPSFVRVNAAGWVGAAIVAGLLLWIALRGSRAESPSLQIAVCALVLAAGFHYGREPGTRIDFEDAHVARDGGHLEPPTGTPNRSALPGGWVVEAGQSLTFLARAGTHDLHAITGLGATIELGGHAYRIDPSPTYRVIRVTIPEDGPVTLRCVSGAVNLDRIELVRFSREHTKAVAAATALQTVANSRSAA